MREWPPITEPELLERLALDDERFFAFAGRLWAAWGRREYEPGSMEKALGYPWVRPTGSYVLRDTEVELLADVEPARRETVIADFTRDRHPILAFGGNASPSWLTTKFGHFPEESDRSALVLAGALHDHDVGPAPAISPLGYMAATLFASPGTAVRAAVVWATAAQITQLTWTEIPYRLGRLDDATFVMDEADLEVEIDKVLAYIHRLGTFCVDGSPVALAAIPATDRTAPAFTQEELLDTVAPMLIGPDARAEDLVRAIFEDMSGVTARASEAVWPSAIQLQSRWTEFPTAINQEEGDGFHGER